MKNDKVKSSFSIVGNSEYEGGAVRNTYAYVHEDGVSPVDMRPQDWGKDREAAKRIGLEQAAMKRKAEESRRASEEAAKKIELEVAARLEELELKRRTEAAAEQKRAREEAARKAELDDAKLKEWDLELERLSEEVAEHRRASQAAAAKRDKEDEEIAAKLREEEAMRKVEGERIRRELSQIRREEAHSEMGASLEAEMNGRSPQHFEGEQLTPLKFGTCGIQIDLASEDGKTPTPLTPATPSLAMGSKWEHHQPQPAPSERRSRRSSQRRTSPAQLATPRPTPATYSKPLP
ncbi:MAG: hypothetical protein O7C56_08055, partial [Rickettsia endosymbiont of Ixodes persulcatus]|nr:hypothetical protein [Rickettsia endosymbiont of Ixodes persulcatus]